MYSKFIWQTKQDKKFPSHIVYLSFYTLQTTLSLNIFIF